jgi:hypothetical protein
MLEYSAFPISVRNIPLSVMARGLLSMVGQFSMQSHNGKGAGS